MKKILCVVILFVGLSGSRASSAPLNKVDNRFNTPTPLSAIQEQKVDCDIQARRQWKHCSDIPLSRVERLARCMRERLSQLTPECRKEGEETVEVYENARPCIKFVNKRCGVDFLNSIPETDEQNEKELRCLLMSWEGMNDVCRKFWRPQVALYLAGIDNPILLTDEDIEEAVAKAKETEARLKARGKFKVAGTGKTVVAEAREGDVIWYKVGEKKRTVVDSYEFCPPIKGKGLEVKHNANMGVCYYKVTAPWGGPN